jgi:RNA polymerase-binding transcription factor DksA
MAKSNGSGNRMGPGANNMQPGTERNPNESLRNMIANTNKTVAETSKTNNQDGVKSQQNKTKAEQPQPVFVELLSSLRNLINSFALFNKRSTANQEKVEKLMTTISNKLAESNNSFTSTRDYVKTHGENQELAQAIINEFVKQYDPAVFQNIINASTTIEEKISTFISNKTDSNVSSSVQSEISALTTALTNFFNKFESTQTQIVNALNSNSQNLQQFQTSVDNYTQTVADSVTKINEETNKQNLNVKEEETLPVLTDILDRLNNLSSVLSDNTDKQISEFNSSLKDFILNNTAQQVASVEKTTNNESDAYIYKSIDDYVKKHA